MDKLSDLVDAVKPRRDGDIVDRLNYAYTTILLATFASAMGGWSYLGRPLHCWYPAYFKGFWIEYANEYCFIQNSYFLRFHEQQSANVFVDYQNTMTAIPKNITKRMDKVLPYYQWAPFVLAFQALFFFLPVVVWRALNGASGLCVNTILTESSNTANIMAPDSLLDKLASYIIYHHDVYDRTLGVKSARRWFVTWLYVLVKFLFVFNAVMQFFLMNHFLGYGGPWGAEVMQNLMSGVSWKESGKFPRVTFCDFEVRELGNLHRHTVQCVLLINMFYEKFYVAFWFWLLCIATINVINLIQWVVIALSYKDRSFLTEFNEYFGKRGADAVDQSYGPVLDRFIDYLGPDGILLLRLVHTNAGGVATGKLLHRLWMKFIERSSMTASPDLTSLDTTPRKIDYDDLDGASSKESSV